MSLRKERMGDEIRDIIAASLTGGQMNDPRLQFVTITGVKLSPDLQLASVHFRVIDEKTQSETRKALDNAAGSGNARRPGCSSRADRDRCWRHHCRRRSGDAT